MQTHAAPPKHIGIIMDGNGRWAQRRGLPREAGHKKGARVFEEIAKYCRDIGVRYLTVYAFSTENWKRPPEEVENVMGLMKEYLRNVEKGRGEHGELRFLGDRGNLDPELRELIERAEADGDDYPEKDVRCTVSIAFNYGGRDEILHAVRALAREVRAGGLLPEEIDGAALSRHLYAPDLPDPDMILRPSGEQRLSNFLLWQSAYAEFVYMDVLWPDFTPAHLDQAIEEFSRRKRRFGGL